ncbi:MAG: hypothetical protein ACJ75B_13200 [Flavisolibacter sp.]
MKKFLLATAILLFSVLEGYAQGCSPIRHISGISPDVLFKNHTTTNRFVINMTNRYFEASNTYRGTKYITDTLVTNRIYSFHISVSAIFNQGWSLTMSIPVSANSRRNSLDHGGPQTPKHITHAFGLGDMRLTAYKWLLNSSPKGNIQLGLGIKFPTGDYRYTDYFFRNDSTKVLAPVDQAIQLGDGGTGITTEIGGFYSLSKTIDLFGSVFCLFNPRDQNGVSNLKGRNPTAAELTNNTTVMSVPDQYDFRGGATIEVKNFVFSAAVRYERLPIKDLIGESNGFRRAADVSSVEPGVVYRANKQVVFAYVGIPFHRNIEQTTANNMTPAGFANVIFTFGAQFGL